LSKKGLFGALLMLNPVLARMASDSGALSPQRVAGMLHMSLGELARVTHIHRNTLTRFPDSPRVQERLGEIARIVATAAELTGDAARALVWFRFQPLAGFENRTAADLVAAGQGSAVLKHLETLADGGYA
jgi:uncharacterized protein (DUF2384 family)